MVRVSSGGFAVRRPPEQVFAFLADVDAYTDFFAGLTHWDALDDGTVGVGAHYRVLLKVGSVSAGGTVRITEWREGRRIAWEWETGVHQSGGWTLTPLPSGTGLDLSLDYSLGGPTAWLVERLTARVVHHNLRATVLGVRRRLEHPELSQPSLRPAGAAQDLRRVAGDQGVRDARVARERRSRADTAEQRKARAARATRSTRTARTTGSDR